MAWSVVKVDRGRKNRSAPSASVGYGRIGLNVAACNLIEDFEKYSFVELLKDPEKPSLYGVRFLESATEESVSIKRKIADGKIVGGIEISSKGHIEQIFGILGTQKKTTVYPVTKDENDNILIIHIK